MQHKQRQIGEPQAHMAALKPPKGGLKDCLIEVLPPDYDDDAWRFAVDRARRLHEQREAG